MSIGGGIGSLMQGVASGYGAVAQSDRDALIQKLLLERDAQPASPVDGGATPASSQATPIASGTGSTGGGLTQAALYDHFVNRGATRNEAAMLSGMAVAESNLNPNVVHDKGTGFGLWGHRNERRDAMFKFAGTNKPSWQQQADFALQELRSRPESARVNSARNPNELTIAGMRYERPRGYTDANPAAGDNFSGRQNYIAGAFGRNQSAPSRSVAAAASSKKPDALDLMNELLPQPRGISR